MPFDNSIIPNLPNHQIVGACSGVYFLYDEGELVYIGEGWNCFLRVAEHTGQHSDKKFTSWSFWPIEDKSDRKKKEKELVAKHQPKHNKSGAIKKAS